MAAKLYHLAHSNSNHGSNGKFSKEAAEQVYSRVANRLAELIDDVGEISIDRDERRRLLTLFLTDRGGTSHPAQALSDGTLRFLALAVLELDPETRGLLCVEEPENGIHPGRIPAMLELLQDIVTDVNESIGPDNLLRQVIVNTHSPTVVSQVPDESLLVAESKETIQNGRRFKRVCFSCLNDTWRTKAVEAVNIVSKGKLMAYLNPIASVEPEAEFRQIKGLRSTPHRVIDRPDLQMLLPFPVGAE